MDETNFLKENKLMNLASLSMGHGPRVVPVAFMYDKGKFYFSTSRATRKVRNILANKQVGFSVEDSTRQKAVVGSGTARILPGDDNHDAPLNKLVVHLVGSVHHPYAKIMMGPNRVIVEVSPKTMRSWELPPT
ncbi:MAG TPA: pyridoxamine 5'-phosphate oxidase family protein [Candidatus Bathyarchaeia archaeon]|jgi:nitroimidazol reductase NimA-like FMN-containing flavoprotein (pyridoxamine 5'-phosphate oxidase superfamily)|nr:pyridoxamine 5'-phosphate oxidase family protein [Candidatus Bathyarchaeia archaeon]